MDEYHHFVSGIFFDRATADQASTVLYEKGIARDVIRTAVGEVRDVPAAAA